MKWWLALFVGQLSFAASWSEVDTLVKAAIKQKHIPGAVVVIGTKDQVLYQKAYGVRDRAGTTNTLDTRYDLASLTKVVATTTAVMQLVERGELTLEQKLSTLYPELAGKPSGEIKIENLLRHRAGLPSGQEVKEGESFEEYLGRALNAPLSYAIDSKTVYSDLSFITLGAIVEKIRNQNLSDYATLQLFATLGMTQTAYSDKVVGAKCALAGKEACRPHDPRAAYFYPRPVGHAGVFSTGGDVAKLAQFYLRALIDQQDGVLKAKTVNTMVTLSAGQERGLGWDLLSELATKPRGNFTPGVSFGHTGFTGTSVWIDPKLNAFLVLLTNRVYLEPDTSLNIGELRRSLANTVAAKMASKKGR